MFKGEPDHRGITGLIDKNGGKVNTQQLFTGAESRKATTQGYKDIYSPMTFKCTQEFVFVTFHSYSAFTNIQNITISQV